MAGTATPGLVLDAGGRARPQVAWRFRRDVAQGAEGLAIGVIRRGDRPARLATGQMLVQPRRLGRLERSVDPLGGPGPRPVMRGGPVVGPTRDAPEAAHRGRPGEWAPDVSEAAASAAASAIASADRSAARAWRRLSRARVRSARAAT